MLPVIGCDHGARCAGCTFLDVPYEAQLEAKAARLAATLDRHPSLAATSREVPVGAAQITGYRRRVKWMVGPAGELGLYAREGDHVVVDLPGCRVVTPRVAEVGDALRRLLANRGDPAALALRAVDIRELHDDAPEEARTGAASRRVWATLVVVMGSASREALERFAGELLRLAPAVRAVFVNEVAPDSVQVLGPTTHTLVGEGHAEGTDASSHGWDRIAGVRILAAPGAFVQAHAGQAAVIAERLRARVRALREANGRALRVLDVFSGSGTWGLAVAAEGAEVVAVEGFAPAATRIAAAAAHAKVRLDARAGDAEACVRRLAQAGERFDLVIANPPRRGLSPGLRAAIASLAPKALAYVSCDPDTLARDLADLDRLGLRAASVTPIDMIPLTDHVEALCFLARSTPPPPRVLARVSRLVAVEKPAHEHLEDLVARMGAQGSGTRTLFAPPSDGSGVVVIASGDGAPERDAAITIEARVAVKGVVRARGRLGRRSSAQARYERIAVASGHSLLRVIGEPDAVARAPEALAAIGHPVLGGRRVDPRTRRHFADRHGLDRAFFHVVRVELGGEAFECPLAPELALVAERLGFA